MSDDNLVIYHNPRCSKSRETLQILQDNNVTATVVEYLKQPPSQQELKDIIRKLGVSARQLLRTTEQAYRDANLDDDSLSEDEIIESICKYPALLQRPIVVSEKHAIIGRPPIKVLEIIA